MGNQVSLSPEGRLPSEYLQTIYRTRRVLLDNFAWNVFSICQLVGALFSSFFLFWSILGPLPHAAIGILFPPLFAGLFAYFLVEQERRVLSEFAVARYLDDRFRTRDLFFTALEHNHQAEKNPCNRQLLAAANHLGKKLQPMILPDSRWTFTLSTALLLLAFMFLLLLVFYLLHFPQARSLTNHFNELHGKPPAQNQPDAGKKGGTEGDKPEPAGDKGDKSSSGENTQKGDDPGKKGEPSPAGEPRKGGDTPATSGRGTDQGEKGGQSKGKGQDKAEGQNGDKGQAGGPSGEKPGNDPGQGNKSGEGTTQVGEKGSGGVANQNSSQGTTGNQGTPSSGGANGGNQGGDQKNPASQSTQGDQGASSGGPTDPANANGGGGAGTNPGLRELAKTPIGKELLEAVGGKPQEGGPSPDPGKLREMAEKLAGPEGEQKRQELRKKLDEMTKGDQKILPEVTQKALETLRQELQTPPEPRKMEKLLEELARSAPPDNTRAGKSSTSSQPIKGFGDKGSDSFATGQMNLEGTTPPEAGEIQSPTMDPVKNYLNREHVPIGYRKIVRQYFKNNDNP